MSEQDKRAEEVWRKAFLAWANVYPADSGSSHKKYHRAVAVEAAALAQARREGVEALLTAGSNKAERVIDCCKPRIMIGLSEFQAEAARLLSKGGTDG